MAQPAMLARWFATATAARIPMVPIEVTSPPWLAIVSLLLPVSSRQYERIRGSLSPAPHTISCFVLEGRPGENRAQDVKIVTKSHPPSVWTLQIDWIVAVPGTITLDFGRARKYRMFAAAFNPIAS